MKIENTGSYHETDLCITKTLLDDYNHDTSNIINQCIFITYIIINIIILI
jgi:hypothetical protein